MSMSLKSKLEVFFSTFDCTLDVVCKNFSRVGFSSTACNRCTVQLFKNLFNPKAVVFTFVQLLLELSVCDIFGSVLVLMFIVPIYSGKGKFKMCRSFQY